ncbi:MAG: hypothetical protein V1760_03745 [Candidatus Peregrinibacteria bacterium]
MIRSLGQNRTRFFLMFFNIIACGLRPETHSMSLRPQNVRLVQGEPFRKEHSVLHTKTHGLVWDFVREYVYVKGGKGEMVADFWYPKGMPEIQIIRFEFLAAQAVLKKGSKQAERLGKKALQLVDGYGGLKVNAWPMSGSGAW